jgi:DNA-binding response OmpR family regulator
MDVHSAQDQGTTFRLTFPRATASSTPRRDAPVAAPHRSVRILVVEDEQELARMANVVLSQRGHSVVVAASGDEALDALHRERFELVISDLGLGAGANGWDLAQAVRDHWPGTRFVLVTGWGAAIDPVDALARGVDEVISKPYRIADLRQVADHVASRSAAS